MDKKTLIKLIVIDMIFFPLLHISMSFMVIHTSILPLFPTGIKYVSKYKLFIRLSFILMLIFISLRTPGFRKKYKELHLHRDFYLGYLLLNLFPLIVSLGIYMLMIIYYSI